MMKTTIKMKGTKKTRAYYFKAYITNRKSIQTIGDDLGLSFTCIRNRLLKYKIKLRSKGWALKDKGKPTLDGIKLKVETNEKNHTLTFRYDSEKYGVKDIGRHGYLAMIGMAMRIIPKGEFDLSKEKALIKESIYPLEIKEYDL